jgi:hypothetical protein
MKTQFFRFLVLSIAFVICSVAAFAQAGSPLKVEIPFNFHIGNEKLTAGTYEIKRISSNSFLFRNETGSVQVVAQTPRVFDGEKSATAENLVFNRYGNKYFLREIFSIRSNAGRGLYESKSEKMARQGWQDNEETAKNGKVEQVVVTMKQN